MISDIRKQLIELARQKTTWYYSQLNDQLQLGLNFNSNHDRKLIGEWLGEISVHEFENDRPLLSALVIHKGGRREQGDGFYKLCEQLYGEDWESLKADKNWENSMIADCFTFWLEGDNYKLYKNDY